MKKKNQANILARECIVEALIQLSYEKDFSTITVSELAERAGVSRMTFYRNYSSKEDVFRTYMDEIVEAYRFDISCTKKPDAYGEYENILRCCRYFEQYKAFISCLLHVGMGNFLLRALNSYMLTTFYRKETDSIALYYALLAYAGALFNIYIAWLLGGAREPVDVLAHILYEQFARSRR